MKKSVSIFVTAVIAMTFVTADVAEARTWKVSHVRPQGTAIDIDLNKFAEALKEESNGKMKVKVYPASALGDYTVVQERVRCRQPKYEPIPGSGGVGQLRAVGDPRRIQRYLLRADRLRC